MAHDQQAKPPIEWLPTTHIEAGHMFFNERSNTHGWRLKPTDFRVYVREANESTEERWSPSTGSYFRPRFYVALWVGKTWLRPHEVDGQLRGRPGVPRFRPEDDAVIVTDGLHISLAYLGQLLDGDLEKINLFADRLTTHIQSNGDWPIRDSTLRWRYESERCFPIRIRTTLGTCKSQKCKECDDFKKAFPEALPGQDPFDTHLHSRDRYLEHLEVLRADFYPLEGLFQLESGSPLHRLCRGIQEFWKSQVRACKDQGGHQLVDRLHLTVGDVWKKVGNQAYGNSTVESERVSDLQREAPFEEASDEESTAELPFICFIAGCRQPSGHWDRCFNCSAHVCSAHRHVCQYNEPCRQLFCPDCSSHHWGHGSSDEDSSDSDSAVEV